MKYTAAALVALATSVQGFKKEWPASNGTTWTTVTTTAFTTYCPESTTFVHHGKTYTVTEATTITITDCPCTISYPVMPTPYTTCLEEDYPIVQPVKTNVPAPPPQPPVAPVNPVVPVYTNPPAGSPVAPVAPPQQTTTEQGQTTTQTYMTAGADKQVTLGLSMIVAALGVVVWAL